MKGISKGNGHALKTVFIAPLKWWGTLKHNLQNRHNRLYKIIMYFKRGQMELHRFFYIDRKKWKSRLNEFHMHSRLVLHHPECESRLHDKSLLIQSFSCKHKQEHNKQLWNYCQTTSPGLLKIISHSMLHISNPTVNRNWRNEMIVQKT